MWTNRQKIINICGQTDKKSLTYADKQTQKSLTYVDKQTQKTLTFDSDRESDNCLLVYRYIAHNIVKRSNDRC